MQFDIRRYKPFVVVSLLTLVHVFLSIVIYNRYAVIGTDAVFYALMGKSLALGKGLVVFGQPHLIFSPLLSVLMVPWYWLIHNRDLVAHLPVLILGSCSVPLCYWLMRMMVRESYALLGTLLFSINGYLLWAESVSVSPHVIASFFSMCILLVLLRIIQQTTANQMSLGYWFQFGVLGVLIGCAYLTRPEYFFLLFPVVVFLFITNRHQPSSRMLLTTLVTVVAFACVAFPYMAYLHKHTGTWLVSGRVNELALALTGQAYENESLSSAVVSPPVLDHGAAALFYSSIPKLLQKFFSHLLTIESIFVSHFGFIGIVLCGFGIFALIISRRFKELGSLFVVFSVVFVVAFAHTGENGYILPYYFLIIVGMIIGIEYVIGVLNERFNFSYSKRILLSTVGLMFVCGYFLLPAVRLYTGLPKDFRPMEYVMMGEWMSKHIPDIEHTVVVSRKPEVAFYAGSNWRIIPNVATIETLVGLMHSQDIQYLVADERYMGLLLPQFVDLVDIRKTIPDLERLHALEYQGQTIVVYRVSLDEL